MNPPDMTTEAIEKVRDIDSIVDQLARMGGRESTVKLLLDYRKQVMSDIQKNPGKIKEDLPDES